MFYPLAVTPICKQRILALVFSFSVVYRSEFEMVDLYKNKVKFT